VVAVAAAVAVAVAIVEAGKPTGGVVGPAITGLLVRYVWLEEVIERG
jgi:hypothetical protein